MCMSECSVSPSPMAARSGADLVRLRSGWRHLDRHREGVPQGQGLASGRFSLCAQTEEVPYKYVSVTGEVASTRSVTDEDRRTLAYRYLGPEIGDLYLEATADEAGESLVYVLRPTRWATVDYAKQFG